MAGLVYKWRNGWKSQDSRTFFLRLRNVGAACLVLWAFVYSLGMTTSNPLSLGILPAAFLCIQYEERRLHVDTREKRILLFLGTFFAVASVLAQPERWSQSVGLLLTLSGLGIFYYYVLKGLYCWQRGRLFFHGERKSGSNRIWKIAGLGILLCWLPFYLSEYPGVVISDSVDQLGQMITGVYRNHHPVAHTWLQQSIIMPVYHWTDSLETGIAVYCALQMLFMALVDGWLVSFLYRLGSIKLSCVAVFAFYALTPYHVMFSFNMWKDTLFAACVLLVLAMIWKRQVLFSSIGKKERVTDALCYLGASLGFCLFRTNGWYAYLVLTALLCMVYWKRLWNLACLSLAVVVAVMIFQGPVLKACGVAPVDTVEALSIPAQQIARVIAQDGEISPAQREQVSKIVAPDLVREAYEEETSDPVKNLVRAYGKQHILKDFAGEYFRLWLELGMRNPGKYLKAYIAQTRGYWYPDVQRWVYAGGVYRGQIDISASPLLPDKLVRFLKFPLLWEYTKIPLLGLLWSPGMAVWLSLMLMALACLQRKKGTLVIYLPILALWGTLLVATPVNGEFRYIYYLFECMPLLIAAACYPAGAYKKGMEKNE